MYNCDKPDWSLLEHAVQQAHLPDAVVGEFMWMCEQPKGMHQYKHRITRRYANLTADTCMPQLLVREAREGYEPTVPYPNSLHRSHRADVINRMSDNLKKAVKALAQVNADLVLLGWQGDNYLNRQTGQRVTIADAMKHLEILARHLAGAKPCAFNGCEARAEICCECGLTVCEDHGTRGGDREGGTTDSGRCYGAYAVPSACYQHGGYNADE